MPLSWVEDLSKMRLAVASTAQFLTADKQMKLTVQGDSCKDAARSSTNSLIVMDDFATNFDEEDEGGDDVRSPEVVVRFEDSTTRLFGRPFTPNLQPQNLSESCWH